jgi:periplasmic protein CpxP/Spy
MKKQTFPLPLPALILGFLVTLAPAVAAAAAGDGKTGDAARAPSARERLQADLAELKLTPEQKERLTPVLRAELEQLAALRGDQSLAGRERLRRLQAVQAETVPKVKAILTPEQFATWERQRAAARAQWQERARDRRP